MCNVSVRGGVGLWLGSRLSCVPVHVVCRGRDETRRDELKDLLATFVEVMSVLTPKLL